MSSTLESMSKVVGRTIVDLPPTGRALLFGGLTIGAAATGTAIVWSHLRPPDYDTIASADQPELIKRLRENPRETSLKLSRPAIEPDTLRQIMTHNQDIRKLHLGNAVNLDDSSLSNISTRLMFLEELSLVGADKITDQTIDVVKGLPNLNTLNICGCSQITTAKVKDLIQTKKGTLNTLYLYGTAVDRKDLSEWLTTEKITTQVEWNYVRDLPQPTAQSYCLIS